MSLLNLLVKKPVVTATPAPVAAQPTGGAMVTPIAAPALPSAAPAPKKGAGELTDEDRAKGKRVQALIKADVDAARAAVRAKYQPLIDAEIDAARKAASAKHKTKREQPAFDRRAHRIGKYGSSLQTFFGYVTGIPADAVMGGAEALAVNGEQLLARLVLGVPGIKILNGAGGSWACVLKHRDTGTLVAFAYEGGKLTMQASAEQPDLFKQDFTAYVATLLA